MAVARFALFLLVPQLRVPLSSAVGSLGSLAAGRRADGHV
jgi:hypothetical protein